MENPTTMHEIFPSKKKLFPRVEDLMGIFAIFLILTIAVVIPAVIVFALLNLNKIKEGADFKSFDLIWMFFVAYIIPMLLTIYLVIRHYKISPRFEFRPRYPGLLPYALVAWVLLLFVEMGITYFLPEAESKFRMMTTMVLNHPFLMFFLLSVAAPILEEMLFRGIILKYLLKKYRPLTAIIISSLVFGLFHMNIWQFVGASLLGLLLGYMYWRSGTLFYSVLIHFLNNTLAFFTVFHYKTMSPDEMELHSAGQALLLIFLASAGAALALYGMENYIKPRYHRVIYLASGNPHKLDEIRALMPPSIRLESLNALASDLVLEETGKDLAANSLQKAMQIARRFGVDVLADDTGLEVDALGGAPGVHSARFAGPDATDELNRQKLLEVLQGHDNRQARFRTVLTLNLGHRWFRFEGIAPGEILHAPQGEGGFGYDPLFRPDGLELSYAQMSAHDKNRISHRGRAMQKLIDFLKKFPPSRLLG